MVREVKSNFNVTTILCSLQLYSFICTGICVLYLSDTFQTLFKDNKKHIYNIRLVRELIAKEMNYSTKPGAIPVLPTTNVKHDNIDTSISLNIQTTLYSKNVIDKTTNRAVYPNMVIGSNATEREQLKTTVNVDITNNSETSNNDIAPWCDNLKTSYPLVTNFSEIIKGSDWSMDGIVPIHSHDFSYTYNAYGTCMSQNINILSVVKSRVTNFVLRKAVRETWGKDGKTGLNRLVFLLGYSNDVSVRKRVHREFQVFGDIIQEDFIDTYYNNSFKTIMGIRWVAKFCPNARYVALIDDDVFINFKNLVDYYKGLLPGEEKTILSGNLHKRPSPFRNKKSKWPISKELYPFKCYPPFLSGAAILTSGYVIRSFNFAIPYVKKFKFDDVYIGIVAQKVGIKPTSNNYVHMGYGRDLDTSKSIALHGFHSYKQFKKMYQNITASKTV